MTGATGDIGSALLTRLHASGVGPLRGLTRYASQAAIPEGVEAVEGDFADPASLKPALEGVRSLFLVSRLGPDAELLGAARQTGVEHVVLVSSITAETHPHLGPAAENLAVERSLKESGVDWTVLWPTQFASNTLMWAAAIRTGGTVRAPYQDTALPTVVHPADIASVARVALAEPGHRGRTYALTGPEPVNDRQQAEAIAAALGRKVPFAGIRRQQARAQLVAVFGEAVADALLDVTGGDVHDGLLAVRDTVARVTGGPARPFWQWGTENAAAFR
ncbi:NAD(P)H-binding protein [Streptomyces sp. NBC_00237]|uniref:NAD(P)H-binding protein n=1 Tax=Streptomyces sp. NBC_00237 TaxID=2975687 RepID=UPI00224DA41F|nr:NAD(P)H-binding protein [Streptomyces sp. NBC_00237]MCX5206676.1 NAD(P)H-binding protein [Streptomyces sp. NBC_00237]